MKITAPTHFCYIHFCYVFHFCYAVFELLTCSKTPVSHFCYDPLTFVTLISSPEKVTKMSRDSINLNIIFNIIYRISKRLRL